MLKMIVNAIGTRRTYLKFGILQKDITLLYTNSIKTKKMQH